MQRRSIVHAGAAAGLLAATAAPAVHAQPVVRWRLASSFPKAIGAFSGATVFARHVQALSGGRFDISVHPAGELVPAFGVVDAVQQGTVEIAHTAPYYFFGKDDVFSLGCAIPFGMNSRQMTAWMLEGNGLRLMREFYAGYNIHNFPGGNTGAQMGGWYRKEVHSLADMKGLKMRIAGLAGKVMARMGVVPQNIPPGEIYQALEKGTIDAAELVGPFDDQKTGLSKVAPYYYYPGWWEGSTHVEFFIHDKAFAALSAENKAVVEAAAGLAHLQMQAFYDAANPLALKQLVGSGARLRPFPADVMRKAFEESRALCNELRDSNPAWRRIYTDFERFRADQNLWFRFSEAGFDRFMQAQKL
ncbi:TRAP transporter substrate-binding protein DctP [Ramlibacter sp. AN1015]|uniref:TRAP transporter substrate-binding protein n=1 Tax=Ramlibacter sp. AN1015 TaxID=3133428 RepID=UPI0030BF8F56